MGRTRTRFARMRVVVASAVALLGILPAAAWAETEPNNSFMEAEGPVAATAPITGTIFSNADEDWFMVYVAGQAQLELTATNTTSTCQIALRLYNADVATVASATGNGTRAALLRYSTAAGTNRFYIRVSGCEGAGYSLTLSPANVVVSGEPALPGTPTSEPNETAAQAFGPLAGGVAYNASADTVNDRDWFFFYASGPTELHVSIASAGSCSVRGYLYNDLAQRTLTGGSYTGGRVSHIRYTLPAAGKYLLRFESCVGQRYQFRLFPAEAITLTAPPPAAVPIATPAPTPPPPPPAAPDARPLPTVSLSGSGSGASARVVGGKVRIVVKGAIKRPAGVSAKQACSGDVVLTIKKGKTLISARTTKLTRACRFSKTVRLARAKVGGARSLRVTVRFQGNSVVKARSKTLTVRVRR